MYKTSRIVTKKLLQQKPSKIIYFQIGTRPAFRNHKYAVKLAMTIAGNAILKRVRVVYVWCQVLKAGSQFLSQSLYRYPSVFYHPVNRLPPKCA